MTNLEIVVIKQGAQIEALEWFFSYVDGSSKPTIEGAIERLEHNGVKSYKAVLIKLWERQNEPHKWVLESGVYGEVEND